MGENFVVFELWKGDVLIAADFAHPVGTHCYVATRCHHPEYKGLGSGFILALVTMKLLQASGFRVYDFGGFDSSPGMGYKQEIAVLYDRVSFLASFGAQIENNTTCTVGILNQGVLIPTITPDDLFDV